MITVHIPPALYRSSSGQLHLVSGCHWLPVPDGTTLEDAGLYMALESLVKPSSCDDTLSDSKAILGHSDGFYEVPGSSGKTYQVHVSNGYYSCTCKGFKWRKKCRHVTELKSQVGRSIT